VRSSLYAPLSVCLARRKFFSHSLEIVSEKRQNKELERTSTADSSVNIQTTSEFRPSLPSWFGEVVVIVSYLRKHGILTEVSERVRVARRRFGHYEVIDFLAVLFGYAISGERTLEAFYARLQPFAIPFMALFERDQLPARSTLSRFLAALPPESVEALRTLFLNDLLSRPCTDDKQTGGLVDRTGNTWMVFDKVSNNWVSSSTMIRDIGATSVGEEAAMTSEAIE
jgi:hypothetical protein